MSDSETGIVGREVVGSPGRPIPSRAEPAGRGGNGELRTYRAAVADGFYQLDPGGLTGKYDNVRRYWEDQITRYALHDFIGPLVARKRARLSRIRVLDLGAGSGEGYVILTSLKKAGDSLTSREISVLPPEILGAYEGLDISPAMVEQGRAIHEWDPKASFRVADLAEGLGPARGDDPYDLYFSSYGSLSHLRDRELRRLVEEVYDHAEGSFVFVADLVGRYSVEWPCYWDDRDEAGTGMRPYSMSYLYPPEMVDRVEVERFPLRYWGGEEFDGFLSEVVGGKGGRVAKRDLRDRSVLVGRHMNTGEFNPHVRPVRAAVNSLHEYNHRTDLSSLLFDYRPRPGHPGLDAFFERFQVAWNEVVYSAIEALEHYDDPEWLRRPVGEDYPEKVREAVRTIRNVVANIKWFRMGDPLANVIEPQLGYTLRNLEMDLQQGMGAAHGLLAIYEIEK